MADLAQILGAIEGLRDDLRSDREAMRDEVRSIHARITAVEDRTRETLALKADGADLDDVKEQLSYKASADRVAELEEKIEPGSSSLTRKGGWLAALLRSPLAIMVSLMVVMQLGSFAAIIWLAVGRLDISGLRQP